MLENFSTWLRRGGEERLLPGLMPRRKARLGARPRRMYGFDRYPCPCCGLPTIDEPGIYDICAVCWWEDDGHEGHSPFSPNGMSLTQAKQNFLENLSIFAVGQEPDGFADTEEQRGRKLRLLESFEALRSDTDSGSQEILRDRIKAEINAIRLQR